MDYNKVQSAVMTEDVPAYDFYYCIFDRVLPGKDNAPYSNRLDWVDSMFRTVPLNVKHTRPAIREIVRSGSEIIDLEEGLIKKGYEGLVLRSLEAPYKQGKSTMREGYGFKLKRTEDAEARVKKAIELEHNMNPADVNELGLTKRSSHQHNKIGSGLLGSFLVEGINGRYKGKEFYVSCGSMTHENKRKHWVRYCLKPHSYVDSIITYTYAKHRGTSDAPAEPRFKCFRED
jgi:DNA ligase-1